MKLLARPEKGRGSVRHDVKRRGSEELARRGAEPAGGAHYFLAASEYKIDPRLGRHDGGPSEDAISEESALAWAIWTKANAAYRDYWAA